MAAPLALNDGLVEHPAAIDPLAEPGNPQTMTIAWTATSAATRYASTLYAVLMILPPQRAPGDARLNGLPVRRRAE